MGHIISSNFEDTNDIEDKRNSFIGQVNSVLCYFGKLNSSTKLRLFNSYCNSFFGSELWDLHNPAIENVSIAWRKAIRRVWALPAMTHGYLLPLISRCLPLYDMICSRFLTLLNLCLNHDSVFIREFVKYAVFHGGMESPVGKNLLICMERFHFSKLDFLNGTFLKNIHEKCMSNNSPMQFSHGNFLHELLLLREQTLMFSSDNIFLTINEINEIILFIALDDIT